MTHDPEMINALLDAMNAAHDEAAHLDRTAKSVASRDPEVRDTCYAQARVQRSIERHLRRMLVDPTTDEDL